MQRRAADVRAGYVYVISNVGAFGPDVVRVNMVNPRREFFYATPAEVRDLLLDLGDDHVLEYNGIAEAVEWRASDPAGVVPITTRCRTTRWFGTGTATAGRPTPACWWVR